MKKKQRKPAPVDWRVVQAKSTDPQGSWTGVPAAPEDAPVQDADDL